mgnify:CR=1 FL=1
MFELSVVTPQGPTLESVQVDEVTAPGVEGEFGVLPGHIPFISATKAGVLSYRKGGETSRVAVGPGYVEVDMKGAVAVLVRKDHDRCVPGIQADFVGLTVPDRYVFGFGMDYEEHGRSLFGIYAA